MPQAIQTKYLPATDRRGSRIKAWCERGSITVGYPHELHENEVHPWVARALCNKFVAEDEKQYGPHKNPWSRPFVSGGLPGGGEAHVFLD